MFLRVVPTPMTSTLTVTSPQNTRNIENLLEALILKCRSNSPFFSSVTLRFQRKHCCDEMASIVSIRVEHKLAWRKFSCQLSIWWLGYRTRRDLYCSEFWFEKKNCARSDSNPQTTICEATCCATPVTCSEAFLCIHKRDNFRAPTTSYLWNGVIDTRELTRKCGKLEDDADCQLMEITSSTVLQTEQDGIIWLVECKIGNTKTRIVWRLL